MGKEREGREETLARYHVRISELPSVLKGPQAKDIHVVHYNKVLVQGANKKTYTYH
jgi:hypothetical protein